MLPLKSQEPCLEHCKIVVAITHTDSKFTCGGGFENIRLTRLTCKLSEVVKAEKIKSLYSKIRTIHSNDLKQQYSPLNPLQ